MTTTKQILYINGPSRGDWTLISLPNNALQDLCFDQELPGEFLVAHMKQDITHPAATIIEKGHVKCILNAPIIVMSRRSDINQEHVADIKRFLFPIDRG